MAAITALQTPPSPALHNSPLRPVRVDCACECLVLQGVAPLDAIYSWQSNDVINSLEDKAAEILSSVGVVHIDFRHHLIAAPSAWWLDLLNYEAFPSECGAAATAHHSRATSVTTCGAPRLQAGVGGFRGDSWNPEDWRDPRSGFFGAPCINKKRCVS